MSYKEGDPIEFDFNNGMKGTGKIRGLASQGIVNMWIVEFDEPISDSYEWSCAVMPEFNIRPPKAGWLQRGLKSAAEEIATWPESKQKLLAEDTEFELYISRTKT